MNKTDGNALFLILIAVALFAALSYAVTQSGRGGGSIDREQVSISAAQIIQYASNLSTAVQRLRVIGGCLDTEINFETPNLFDHVNASAPGDGRCDVFEPEGANVTYTPPRDTFLDGVSTAEDWYGDWFFYGNSCVFNVGTGGTNCFLVNGSTDSDLITFLPYVSKEVCDEINRRLGITTGDTPRINDEAFEGGTGHSFDGVYRQRRAVQSAHASSNSALLDGQPTGCFEGDTTPAVGTYAFYHTLIER